MPCDHDAVDTPELDAAVAREAMRQQDWPHAAFHVASALSRDPERPDLLALLDELVARVGGVDDALRLYPLEGGTWFGPAAVHARLLAPADPGAALSLLCDVAVARPDVPFFTWALPWVEVVDGPAAARAVARLLRCALAPDSPTAPPALELLAGLRRRFPEQETFWWVASILARRSGRLDEAVALATHGLARWGSWNLAVALANAHRERGDVEGAEAAWERAIALDPGDVSARLDQADHRLSRRDLAGARAKYQEVLALQPGHPWATPSLAFVDWRDPERRCTVHHRLALEDWARAHPDAPRGRELADLITPWVGWLPGPTDATVRSLDAAAENGSEALSIGVSEQESPSSAWAAREAFGQAPRGPRRARPDGRTPRSPERWTPWRWSADDEPAPNLPPPPAAVSAALAAVAAGRFDAHAWLAADVAGTAEQLLAATLHPGAPPDRHRPWHWRWRVVHAAAFALAGRPGWASTDHRAALRSMLAVRQDWLAGAAAVALAARALADAEVRAEVAPLLHELLVADRPDVGGWCLEWPLAHASWLLAEDPARRALAAQVLHAVEDGAD